MINYKYVPCLYQRGKLYINRASIHCLNIDFSCQLGYQEGPEICEPAGNPSLLEIVIEQQAGYPKASDTVLATYVQITEPIPKVLMPVSKGAGMTDISYGNKKLFTSSSFHCLPLKQILGHGNKIRKLSCQTT